MEVPMNRRAFIASSATAALAVSQAAAQTKPQSFIAGLVPTAPRPPGTPAGAPRPAQSDAERIKSYFLAMDDASRLGVHNIEKTQPAVAMVDMYKGRENEFRDEL